MLDRPLPRELHDRGSRDPVGESEKEQIRHLETISGVCDFPGAICYDWGGKKTGQKKKKRSEEELGEVTRKWCPEELGEALCLAKGIYNEEGKN